MFFVRGQHPDATKARLLITAYRSFVFAARIHNKPAGCGFLFKIRGGKLQYAYADSFTLPFDFSDKNIRCISQKTRSWS